ncbi:MAG: hypothetical protein Q8Q94_04655 [bacterium]|nr:hypothetical protein [bacterium]MDZ4299934.1 hypothetical protein [Candidatus Sungbacteria bacterium]
MIKRLVKPCESTEMVERMILYSLISDAVASLHTVQPRVARLLPSTARDVFTVFYAAFMDACGKDIGRLDADRGWCERLTRRALEALRDAGGVIHPPLYAVFTSWWGCMAGREDQHYGGRFLALWQRTEWWCAETHRCVNGHEGWRIGLNGQKRLTAELGAQKNILLPSMSFLHTMGSKFGARSADLFISRE